MKQVICLLIPLLLLGACRSEAVPSEAGNRMPDQGLSHGMIQLGEKLDDPFTVQNMQEALATVYPTKAGRAELTATDYYVRFLPKTEAQLQWLQKKGLYLQDHPMDYRIVREGDWYQDPEVGDESITWQYAVVPRSFSFPADIPFELLDECYLAEHDGATRADGIDWARVEEEAFRRTGNQALYLPPTKADTPPAGRITIEDPLFCDGKPFGVAGVKVVANIFVRIASAYTDRDGYYALEKSFTGTPRYRLVFQNEMGFNIGFNWVLVPASVSTLGTGGPEGMDCHVTADSDGALFRRCCVNNAAYDFYSRCEPTDLDISAPPGDLRIWIFPSLSCSSAPMLHHGAFLDNALLQQYLGAYLGLIRIFLPDITLGTQGQDYAGIYSVTAHELAHASHFAQVGTAYWTPYINYVLQCFVTEGGRAYGSGTAEGANYCELGEMWGYFLQASLYADRYGGTMPTYGSTFWFKPDILRYLYERGISRGELYRALGPEVTSIEDFKDQLISITPSNWEDIINQVFRTYGK